jgi:hypothetical protein
MEIDRRSIATRQWFSAGKPGSESDSRFPQPDAAGGGARTPAHGRAWADAQHLSSVPLCIDSGPAPWQIAIAARGAAHKPPDGGKRGPRAWRTTAPREPFGWNYKPAEKHRWLIFCERKILFRLKLNKTDYKPDKHGRSTCNYGRDSGRRRWHCL